MIYSSDLDASQNMSRKSNLNVIFKQPDEDQMIFNETSNVLKSSSTASAPKLPVKSAKSEPVAEANKKPFELVATKESNIHQKENIKAHGYCI